MDPNAINQLVAHGKLSNGGDEITGEEVNRPDLGKYEIPENPV